MDIIDKSNTNGTMEFSVPSEDTAAFFPIQVVFSCLKSMCGVQVDILPAEFKSIGHWRF